MEEQIKRWSDLGRRGMADQMREAQPCLQTHTFKSGNLDIVCARMCVFCSRRTLQLFVPQSNSWHRSVLHLFLYPYLSLSSINFLQMLPNNYIFNEMLQLSYKKQKKDAGCLRAQYRLRSIYKSYSLAIRYITSATAYRISKCVCV